MIVFVRYRHIVEYNREDVERVLRLNRFAFWVGMMSPLGMIMVGSFQVGKGRRLPLSRVLMLYDILSCGKANTNQTCTVFESMTK